jgi:hypothetical protein
MGDFPHMWEDFPSHVWEDFPSHIGGLPMCGKSSHMWEACLPPYVGRLTMHGKSSHVWEVFPQMGSFCKLETHMAHGEDEIYDIDTPTSE